MLRYKQALQYFASKLGVTAQEVQDRLNNFVATYPGPDCLEPHEVELAYEGRLPLYRLEHTHQCDDCQALLELEVS